MLNDQDPSVERERLKSLHEFGILDTPPEHEFDNLINLAALICNVPIALITLIDEDRLWFKATLNTDPGLKQIPRKSSFSEFTILNEGVFEVQDTLLDERFKNEEFVINSPFVRFYAGASLMDENGFKLGVVSVFGKEPQVLTQEQRDGLMTIAKEVMTHLLLRKSIYELDVKKKRFDELLTMSAISPEIHCILDEKGHILFINEAVNSLLEYSVEEAIGLRIWDVCYKDDIKSIVEKVEEGLKNNVRHFNIDFRIVSKSGKVRWISWNIVCKSRQWYTYGRDITESKRVENELMKLSFVASKVNNAVVINDANDHVTYVNDAFEKITGFNLEDLKGKRLGDLITGPGTDLELIRQARELNKQNQSFTVDLLSYRKDKKPIWLSIHNTVVLDEFGNVDIEVEIIIDITEKKQAEQELQVLSLVASQTNTGVNICDGDGCTTWVNQSLEKLTGYSLEDLRGKQIGSVLSSEDSDQELIVQSRNKSLQKEAYSIEVQGKTKDGELLWLSVSNTPIINSQGILERQIELISDITQRKQVEREMIDAKEKALQLSEAKEMFLSVMSHEIRTPLNAILGMTHLLIDNKPRPSQLEDLNILKFSGENLLHIINDILDFTKVETGNLQLESIPFSLRSLSTDILNSLQVNVHKKENQLQSEFDERIPDKILGDKTRLYQVLMNLLGNAMKFTEHGLIKLAIYLENETAEDITVNFKVSDNGIGIPKDKQSYIFESFTQAKSNISRKYGGTGLGLAITKKLLKLYKSEIEVVSEEGKGSIFSFSITFLKALLPIAHQKASEQPAVFKGKKVLVVDDNEINVLIARRIFSKWGLEIDFASDGYQAIEKVKSNPYDLVFMDIKMPGIDGFETTLIIRDLPGDYFKKLPIIALTASTLSNENTKFNDAGMNGHMLKPFNPIEIKALLTDFLRSSQQDNTKA
jgi:PAS domain S-box-containing protein